MSRPSFGSAQGVPLLKTKLFIPPVRRELVSRPRLVERLSLGLQRRLTIISAPAGFGKTTLLSDWVHARGAVGEPHGRVAWVSLDDGDNDPARFWTYLLSALQTVPDLHAADVGAGTLSLLRSSSSSPIEMLLTGLINDLAEMPLPGGAKDGAYVLILDDLHLVTEGQVHEGLTWLLDNLPRQLHLIVAGRADPPWPLARWRSRRELNELRTSDLRFTPEEVAAFLNQVMQLDLSPEDLSALDQRTEGWIAGLQMAAIAMRSPVSGRKRRARQGAHSASGFVRAFTGSHRFILDYLVEEVLEKQVSNIRDFLLRTSILERLSAPLCDAVLEVSSTGGSTADDRGQRLLHHLPSASQRILEQVEAANLFLIPLDEVREWYRYHHLFADLLRSRLEHKVGAEGLAHLHRRAGVWYRENGYVTEAVGHALLAGDLEQAASLVERNVLAFKDHGELPTVMRWLDAFPQEVLYSRPWLCVAKSWALAYVGQSDAAEPLLQKAETALAGLERGEDSQHVAGHIAAIRAYTTLFEGDLPRAAEWGRRALEHLPVEDVQTRQSAATTLASALRLNGDYEGAGRVLAEAVATSRTPGSDQTTVRLLCALAGMQIGRGKLRQATATLRTALRLAERTTEQGEIVRLPAAGHVRIRLSTVLYRQNDLDGALREVQQGIEQCRRWGQANALWEGHRMLGDILQAMGDEEGAREAMDTAVRIATGISTWVRGATEAHQAALWLQQGDLAAATRWAEESGLAFDDDIGYRDLEVYSILALILKAQGKRKEAQELLERLWVLAHGAGAGEAELAFLVFQANLRWEQGEREPALRSLEQALALAEAEGTVRPFVDGGAAMGSLLQQAAARGIAVELAARILAALDADARRARPRPREEAPPATVAAARAMVEPLTDRELEVLRFLATTLSAPEIAQELYISVSTVRSHIKSIYGKLGVHRRGEAVERAMELGLI